MVSAPQPISSQLPGAAALARAAATLRNIAASGGSDAARTSPLRRTYTAARLDSVTEFLAEAARLGPAATVTAFQSAAWLGSFYADLAPASGAEPVLIAVRNAASGQIAMLLPLLRRRCRGYTVIEIADLDVCDYGFPVLGPSAPRTPAAAADAWSAVLECLPRADLVRLDRQPASVSGAPNPLVLLGVRSSGAVRNVIDLPETWDGYLGSRSKTVRRNLRQKTRTLTEQKRATFRIVTDAGEANGVLASLDSLQRARLGGTGSSFKLDRPPYSGFYREAVRQGLADGSLRLAVLEAEGAVIAAAMLLLHQETGTMVRLAHAGGEWDRLSPSAVLAGAVIKWLIEQGFRTFDFGAGQYAYKQRFGCELVPLHVIEQPMSPRGRVAASAIAAGEMLRAWPLARSVMARWRRAGRRDPAGADGDNE